MGSNFKLIINTENKMPLKRNERQGIINNVNTQPNPWEREQPEVWQADRALTSEIISPLVEPIIKMAKPNIVIKITSGILFENLFKKDSYLFSI